MASTNSKNRRQRDNQRKNSEKWWAMMVAKHGSKEAVQEVMSKANAKSAEKRLRALELELAGETGTEMAKQAVAEYYRQMGAKAGPTDKPQGFAYDKLHGNDDHIKEMSNKALKTRWGDAKSQEETQVS